MKVKCNNDYIPGELIKCIKRRLSELLNVDVNSFSSWISYELMAVAEDSVTFNEIMYEKLASHGFSIFDTSKNREKVLSEIVERINV